MKFLKWILLALISLGATFMDASFAQTDDPASDVGSLLRFSKGISNLLNAPKDENAENAERVESFPIPKNAGVVLRAPSLQTLDKSVDAFFRQTSETGFSFLSALRLTAYRGALANIDLNSEVGVLLFCEDAPPQIVAILPVSENKFEKFVVALSKAASEEDRVCSIGSDKKTANLVLDLPTGPHLSVVRQINSNYVALAASADASALDYFLPDNIAAETELPLPPSITDSVLTLEATPNGLELLTDPKRPFWTEIAEILAGLDEANEDVQIVANLEEIREYARGNLATLRVDVSIDDYALYLSTQSAPREGSAGEKRVGSYRDLPSLNAEADRFFVVLPDVEAPLSGQSEISPFLAEALPKPFHRLRFIEYSLNLPTETELAAESWLFYLEVDNAEEFVKEMIIPKAREIGGYIGSKEIADVDSQLFGAIAERRQTRQGFRNRPIRGVSPEESSARGAALGSLIGGAIGADSGEQMAMKRYKFDDYGMYISDLETYARQKALMKAEERGNAPKDFQPTLIFDRNRPLLSALDVVLANAQNGEPLQASLLRSANQRAEQVDNSPLIARKSNIVVLDDNHLLIGLGNESLLRYAVNNWKSLSRPSVRYLSLARNTDGIANLQKLCEKLPNRDESRLISAIRVDLPSSIAYGRWVAQNYLPNAPQINLPDLPDDTPNALVVSTLDDSRECTRVVLPNRLVANAFSAFADGRSPLQLILQPQRSNANETQESNRDADGDSVDLDDVFSE